MEKVKIDWSKYTEPELKLIYDAAVTLMSGVVNPLCDVNRKSWVEYCLEKAAVTYDTLKAKAVKA